MSDAYLTIGDIIRQAMVRQFASAGLDDKARSLTEHFDDARANAIGELIVRYHRREEMQILAEIESKAREKVAALEELRSILAANPELLADIDDGSNGELLDKIESNLRVQKTIVCHAVEFGGIMKPSRQNAPATAVAMQIAHLFRQLGLKPSAAKRGPEPSTIFGQCVQDVFFVLGEKANWRRAAESAVDNGEAHMRAQDELFAMLAFVMSRAFPRM